MTKEPFWGRGVRDWVDIQEPLHRPLYETILDAFALKPGQALFDAGCGSGVVCVLAANRGLDVTGLDASPAFIEVARQRCPSGRFAVGNLSEPLPFADESFDGVMFSNSLQFVPNAGDAMHEAVRVLKPGGRTVIAVFDAPEKCAGQKPIGAIMSLLPAGPATSRSPFELSHDRMLENLLRDAGLEYEGISRVEAPWRYRDLQTALRAFTSAGPSQQAIEIVGEEKLRAILETATTPFLQTDGTYLLENVFMVASGRKSPSG
jgi:ubiquinone/menaquinone biosynthesis C-methylase UbiE